MKKAEGRCRTATHGGEVKKVKREVKEEKMATHGEGSRQVKREVGKREDACTLCRKHEGEAGGEGTGKVTTHGGGGKRVKTEEKKREGRLHTVKEARG